MCLKGALRRSNAEEAICVAARTPSCERRSPGLTLPHRPVGEPAGCVANHGQSDACGHAGPGSEHLVGKAPERRLEFDAIAHLRREVACHGL